MIIVTGAAGFIGANIVQLLNRQGVSDVLVVDDFRGLAPDLAPADWSKFRYLRDFQISGSLDRDDLERRLSDRRGGLNPSAVKGVIHMGACSDTTVTDRNYVMRVNLEYTQMLWRWCAEHGVPLVYASSAATYGGGELGYDDESDPAALRPLNLYGESKQLFDLWALEQKTSPPRWAGLKFFNVYGPMESHKGRMASVVYHGFNQIRDAGHVKLFKSHRQGIPDGGQKRDFVYVKDAARASVGLLFLPVTGDAPNGLYNVGTGIARSFADLARATFSAMGTPTRIEYIPMPDDLQGRYQYFTQASVAKLTRAGLHEGFHSLENGVLDYVAGYLAKASV